MSGIIIVLPYSCGQVPPPVYKKAGLNDAQWRAEHRRLVDPILPEIAKNALINRSGQPFPDRVCITYPFSPLVADPCGHLGRELAEDGDHFFPASTSEGHPSPAWTEADKNIIRQKTLDPFYEAVTKAADHYLGHNKPVLIVTLRSHSHRPWRFENDQAAPRPQISLGTSTDAEKALAIALGRFGRSLGWWMDHNRPYAGSWKPSEYRRKPNVFGLGLSVRRDLYLDFETGRPKPSIKQIIRVLRTLLSVADQELESLSNPNAFFAPEMSIDQNLEIATPAIAPAVIKPGLLRRQL